MQYAPSLLSIGAMLFYCLTVIGCWTACANAINMKQQAWHWRCWLLLGVIFCVLIASRFYGLEEALRADLRSKLRAHDMIDGRNAWQGWLIAAALAAIAASGLIIAYKMSRQLQGRRNIAVALAGAGCAIMLATIVLRSISLHAMDRLLYGPLKLNWVGDLGASALVLGAAIYYVFLLQGRIGRPRR